MKLRSGRNLGTSAPPRSAGRPRRQQADRISTLCDDLLILILVRLGCAATAARAGLVSRRWRGLWTRLPALVFRGVGLHSLRPAVASLLTTSAAVSLLDIRLADQALYPPYYCTGERISSLLRTAARLSPDQLLLALSRDAHGSLVELPCYARATSISITARDFPTTLRPPSDDLPALITTLVLTGCAVRGLAAWVSRCPRLSVLRLVDSGSPFMGDVTVHSASLRELVLDEMNRMRRIDISTRPPCSSS